MLLQQICSGRSNGFVQSFHTAYWENSRYLIYGTGNKLVIYDGPEFVQTIDVSEFLEENSNEENEENEEKIFSVELSEFDGKIAVTIGTNVLIFKPNQDYNIDSEVQWSLLKILKHDCSVSCTSWSLINGQLLVGGESIVLWEQDEDNHNKWTKIWEQRVASKVIHIEISPDSTLIATVGEYDRYVKIWCCPKNDGKERKYKFHYLPHPRSVTNFSWRKGPPEQINSQGSNILLTACKDGICRIWAATNPDEPHNLYVCTVVDPEQSLVTLPSSEEERICHKHLDCFSPIHWIHPREFLVSVKLAMDSFDGEIEQQSHIGAGLKKLKNLANDTPDLLFQVQQDGSMVVWGIRNVYCRPRRIPKVLVLLRVSQVLSSSETEYFHGSTFVFHDNTNLDFNSTSVELTILAQSPQGRINRYSIRLVDMFENIQSTQLQLINSWTGHSNRIKTMVKSLGTDCFVSFACNGNPILWDITTPDISQLVKQVGPNIIERCSVPLDSKNSQIKLVCVLPEGKCLAAYDGSRIVLFIYDDKSDDFTRKIVFDDYDDTYELLLLFAYQHKANSSSPISTYIVGVSSHKNTVFCWNVLYDKAPRVNLVSKAYLPIDSHIKIAVPVEQWAGSNKRCYPSEDLSPPILLTYSDDGYIIYWQAHVSNNHKTNKELWLKEVTFKIGNKEPVLIRCGPQGKAAVVMETKNGYEMTIWECITKRLPHAKDFIEEFSEKIVDIDWLFTSNAEIVLAVATSRKICIYTQLRKHHIHSVSDRGSWIMISEIDCPNNSLSISAMSWGSAGSLIVANCNQLRCYNKWLTEESMKKVSSITGVNQKYPTLFHVVDQLNGPLPHYHPTLLLQHILWDKMDLVKQIFAHLYKFLKILIGEDKPVKRILPLPFDRLFQDNTSTASTQAPRYNLLFGDDSDEEGSQDTLVDFTEQAAKFLSEQLKVIPLPGLSHVEQLQLLALVDTVNQVEGQKRSLDKSGVRYVLFMRRYHYLSHNKLISPGLNYRDMNWALHSNSQDLLIEYSVKASGGKFLWKDARIHGIFLWLQSNESVRQQFENIARNHYMSKEERDPTDCSLFYMALRKKKLLLGLWRGANSHREQAIMLKFLINDFTEQRWKTAALKNAYVLLGKQRYEYAAAFFLLGDKLKDAVNVCLKHLNDFQLAIAITRVYEGDNGPILKKIYEDYVIPLAISTGDRWLASLAFWSLNQRDKAVKAIMVPLETLCDKKVDTTPLTTDSPDAALVVLYTQLKDKTVQTLKGAAEISPDTEYYFALRSIFAYDRMGCPLLALYLVRTWTFSIQTDPERPYSILRSRRRTTVFDMPIANSDDVISKGVVKFDTWNWDEPISPVSSRSSKHILDRSDDIFSDEPSPIVSPITPRRLSYTDPFKDQTNDEDIWGWNSHQRLNSFSSTKTDIFNNSEETLGKNDAENDAGKITLLDDVDFYDYKVSLIKRLCQQLLDAVMTVQEDPELYEKHYNDYVNRLEQGLVTICKEVKVPISDIKDSLISCIETDSYNLLKYFQSHDMPTSGGI